MRRRRFSAPPVCEVLSSRCLSPGSIVPQAPARVDGWMPGTSPGMTREGNVPGNLSLDELKAAVAAGSIDTVLVAMVDMQGRLIGKRFQAEYFVGGAHAETHG